MELTYNEILKRYEFHCEKGERDDPGNLAVSVASQAKLSIVWVRQCDCADARAFRQGEPDFQPDPQLPSANKHASRLDRKPPKAIAPTQ